MKYRSVVVRSATVVEPAIAPTTTDATDRALSVTCTTNGSESLQKINQLLNEVFHLAQDLSTTTELIRNKTDAQVDVDTDIIQNENRTITCLRNQTKNLIESFSAFQADQGIRLKEHLWKSLTDGKVFICSLIFFLCFQQLKWCFLCRSNGNQGPHCSWQSGPTLKRRPRPGCTLAVHPEGVEACWHTVGQCAPASQDRDTPG